MFESRSARVTRPGPALLGLRVASQTAYPYSHAWEVRRGRVGAEIANVSRTNPHCKRDEQVHRRDRSAPHPITSRSTITRFHLCVSNSGACPT